MLTINVLVVYMAWYVMVLRRATSLRGALEGVGPENRDFLGPEMPTSDRYIGNFMYTSVVALLCVVVCRYVGILVDV